MKWAALTKPITLAGRFMGRIPLTFCNSLYDLVLMGRPIDIVETGLSYAGLTRVSIQLHKNLCFEEDRWPGHRRAEATPSLGRLRPAMTIIVSAEMMVFYAVTSRALDYDRRRLKSISPFRAIWDSTCPPGTTPSSPIFSPRFPSVAAPCFAARRHRTTGRTHPT